MNKASILSPRGTQSRYKLPHFRQTKDAILFRLFSLFDQEKTGVITQTQILHVSEAYQLHKYIPMDKLFAILDHIPKYKKNKISYTGFMTAFNLLNKDDKDSIIDIVCKVNWSALMKAPKKSVQTQKVIQEIKSDAEEITNILQDTKSVTALCSSNVPGANDEESSENIKDLMMRIEWALQKISGGKIFESYVGRGSDPRRTSRKLTTENSPYSKNNYKYSEKDHEVAKKWLVEYSNSSNLSKSKGKTGSSLTYKSRSLSKTTARPEMKIILGKQAVTTLEGILSQKKYQNKSIPELIASRHFNTSDDMNIMELFLEKHKHDIDTLNDYRNFDIFDFAEKVGRQNTMVLMFTHIIKKHQLFESTIISQEKFPQFMTQIFAGYKAEVQYHNDLHGADVAYFCDQMLSIGELKEVADLSSLDIASLLVAAVTHDFKHPGFNNGFQVNTRSSLAIRYNDSSVLENYHAAQTFKILAQQDCNIFCNLNDNERNVVRKRMVNCVIATDMAKHANLVTKLNGTIKNYNISMGENREELIKNRIGTEKYDAQQFILEVIIHAGDVSNPSKRFDSFLKWTNLLFEEFFHQGDTEKKMGLPVSFLCDRDTQNIPQSQIGFSNGITLPLFELLTEIFPPIGELSYIIKENVEQFKKIQETGEYKLPAKKD